MTRLRLWERWPLTRALTAEEIAASMDQPPHDKVWLALEDLADRWGVTPTHVYNESAKPGFPVPDINAKEITLWLKPDIERYELERANERRDYCLYRHFDAAGRLLYVGQSLSVLTRVSDHRKSPWFREIATIKIERFPTKAALDEAEKSAIRNEMPPHNKYHRPRDDSL